MRVASESDCNTSKSWVSQAYISFGMKCQLDNRISWYQHTNFNVGFTLKQHPNYFFISISSYYDFVVSHKLMLAYPLLMGENEKNNCEK